MLMVRVTDVVRDAVGVQEGVVRVADAVGVHVRLGV